MRVLVASLLAAVVVVAGGYSVLRSVQSPTATGAYTSYTTGSSHVPGAGSRMDWTDRINAGFDE